MIASDIISRFETQVDDATELSSTQELALLNKVYHKVCSDRPWEFLKASQTGTLSVIVPYVTLPSDFEYLLENNKYSDNNVGVDNNMVAKVVFVGSSYTPYQVINWSDRRQYLNKTGYVYLDMPNGRLYFTQQPTTADSYEYDYKSNPTDLLAGSTPLIPTRFQDMLYHAMAIEDEIIQKFPKAQSNVNENRAAYQSYFDDMAYWNASLQVY